MSMIFIRLFRSRLRESLSRVFIRYSENEQPKCFLKRRPKYFSLTLYRRDMLFRVSLPS